jgi:hypothetical protein
MRDTYCGRVSAIGVKYDLKWKAIWKEPINYADMRTQYREQVKLERAQLRELEEVPVRGVNKRLAASYVEAFRTILRKDADFLRRYERDLRAERYTVPYLKKLPRLTRKLAASCKSYEKGTTVVRR